MDQNFEDILNEYQKLFSLQEFKEEDLDYSRLEDHIRQLANIHVMKNGSIAIFDLYKKEHVYISSQYESILGYGSDVFLRDPKLHLVSLVHPDDIGMLYYFGTRFFRFGLNMPMDSREELKDYKYITDYRIKKKNGKYTRVIEQHVVIELDNAGNAWLALSIMDLSPEEDLNTPCRARVVNLNSGEVYKIPFEAENKPRLSKREKEILSLIADGKASKQIADELCISTHTVNTHRQRIIEKMKVSNTAEAVRYAGKVGLLA